MTHLRKLIWLPVLPVIWFGASAVSSAESEPEFAWVNEMPVVANRIVSADTNGNFFLTGSFKGAATFGSNTFNTVSNNTDMYVGKMDRFGNWLWVHQISSTNPTNATATIGTGLAVFETGDFAVTGWVDSLGGATIQFGTTNFAVATGNPGSEIFVAKYGNDGTCLWARGTGGFDGASLHGIDVDRSNNMYIGAFPLTTNDFFLMKLDPAGNPVWRRGVLPGSGSPLFRTVKVDNDGNSYFCGKYYPPLIIDGLTLTNNNSSGEGIVMKFDPGGNLLWARSTSNNSAMYISSYVGDLALDSQTNVVVTGASDASVIFGVTIASNNPPGLARHFVLKLSPQGSNLWIRTVNSHPSSGTGPSRETAGFGVAVDGADRIYTTGDITGSADVDGLQLSSAGLGDVLMTHYDSEGNLRWAKAIGSSNGAGFLNNVEVGRSIAAGPYGVLVSGVILGPAKFGTLSFTNTVSPSRFLSMIQYAPPNLRVERAGELVTLSWPTFPLGFAIESTDDLNVVGVWNRNFTPTVIDKTNYTSFSLSGPAGFFRLRRN